MDIGYINQVQPNKNIYFRQNTQKPLLSANNFVCKYDTVNFTGLKVKQTPFLKSTYKEIMDFYKDYSDELGEISLKSIIETTNNIVKDTNHSRKDVLEAMQQLTQFGNMESVKTISKELHNAKVEYIGNTGQTLERLYCRRQDNVNIPSNELRAVIYDDIGINNTLTYLIENKGFADDRIAEGTKTAVILDENKLSQIEKLKEKHPEYFKKFMETPDIKFFYISGWDNGISIANRNKNLEEETRKLLDYADKHSLPISTAIDAPYLQRINKLGITPTVIKKEGLPTELNVHRQLAPVKITKNELFHLIDANSQIRADGDIIRQYKIQNKSIDYIKNNLTVYTPEKLSKSLKQLHEKIINRAKAAKLSPKDIIYAEPGDIKSYCLINYFYQKVNNIPKNQFVEIRKLQKSDSKNKMVVFLDDCTISGDSINYTADILKHRKDKKTPLICACVCGTENSIVNFSYSRNSSIVINDIINLEPTKRNHLYSKSLEKAVGAPKFSEEEATCLILPYMAPDNNTELGANIALLHNIKFRERNSKTLNEIRHNGVKSYNTTAGKVALLTNKLQGAEPLISDKDFSMIKAEHPRPLKKKIIDFFQDVFDV